MRPRIVLVIFPSNHWWNTIYREIRFMERDFEYIGREIRYSGFENGEVSFIFCSDYEVAHCAFSGYDIVRTINYDVINDTPESLIKLIKNFGGVLK